MFPRLLKVYSTDFTITFKLRQRKRLDLIICDEVKRTILKRTSEQFYQVNLDLKDIGFIDTAAINMLMEVSEALKLRGYGFSIINVSEQAMELLKLTPTLGDLIVER